MRTAAAHFSHGSTTSLVVRSQQAAHADGASLRRACFAAFARKATADWQFLSLVAQLANVLATALASALYQ